MSITAKHGIVSVAAVAALLVAFQPSQSQAADPYYEGKTIRFVVGFGAGGGYDTYSRMLAPLFAKETGATVIVENQPGAGGMVSLNKLAVAPPDGLQMTIINGTGVALQQLLEMPGARFDIGKFKVLGTVDAPKWNFLLEPKSPYNTLQEAMKADKVLTFGGSGKVSGTSDGAAMTCYTLKMKCKIIAGYKGSRDTALALAQGEVDGLYVSETSAYRYVASKNAKAIATMNRERSKLFPDLPTVFEQLPNLTKDQEWWLDFRATVESLGRVLVMPPSTPQNLTRIMQAAAHKIMSDPKVVAEFNAKRRYINYIEAGATEKNMEKVLNAVTPEQKAQLKEVVLGY
jgi:tripartite-type tricarboxylate transporter receptor subunit TctC